jgi:hypothetical protein
VKLRPGIDRREAEREVAETLAEVAPWLTAEHLAEEPKGLLRLLFRPRLVTDPKRPRGGNRD